MALWVLNELSLDNQFANPTKFVEALRDFLKARQNSETLRASLRITPLIAERPVCAGFTFKQAVDSVASTIERQQVITWIANQGPFWTADRPQIDDDLFYCGTDDVTDTGLGDTARRRLTAADAEALSFVGARAPYGDKSITLIHGLLQAPLGQLDVPNITDLSVVVATCTEAPAAPTSWNAALDALQNRFSDVWFAPNLADFLDGHPFVPYVYERAIELIGVLDKMAKSRDASGAWGPVGKHLHATHFVGDKAWFTDESDANKGAFKGAMTFRRESGNDEMCPFHGKIKTPQYRIHFPWPPEAGKPIEIVYIGPKITKA
jgi:hypothetical protein